MHICMNPKSEINGNKWVVEVDYLWQLFKQQDSFGRMEKNVHALITI